MLISPAEPAKLRAIGNVSSLPEKYGADFLFPSARGLVGVQRKEIKDFIASVRDGRLGKELVQMQQLPYKTLILEGRIQWTNDGRLMNGQVDWNKGQHYSSLMSVQDSNVRLLSTDSMADTIELIQKMETWLQKETHTSFLNREKPKGKWGRANSKEWMWHLYQSFDGIGLGTAKAIHEYFEGVPILKWTVSYEELLAVDGIGPKRAASLIESLETTEQ
jgi:ERCC4-type nuclease